LLRRCERRRANAFGLNGSSILTGSEHEIDDTRAEDGLLALIVVQRVDQRERLVVLAPERPDFTALDRERGRLRGGQAWRHARLAAGERQVDGAVVSAVLQHPGSGGRRGATTGSAESVLGGGGAAAAR